MKAQIIVEQPADFAMTQDVLCARHIAHDILNGSVFTFDTDDRQIIGLVTALSTVPPHGMIDVQGDIRRYCIDSKRGHLPLVWIFERVDGQWQPMKER